MDRVLVELARTGDREAFAAVAQASTSRLFAVATLILRDRDLAEDAVQEALISAWRSIRALRDADAWDAWVHRLTVRACYAIARRQRRFNVVELKLGEMPETSTSDGSSTLADRDQLERGFSALALDQRAIVVLHYYRDFSLSEVAGVLGVPLGTVKSRLHRATQSMRAVLEADAREPLLVGENA